MIRGGFVRTCILALVMVATVAFTVGGCTKKEIRRPAPAMMPGWCMASSGALDDARRGPLVIGIGRVEGIKSMEMARANVDGQARLAVAKVFDRYIEKLLNAYRDYRDADGNATAESEIESVGKAFAKLNVRSAPVEDRYINEESNTWYSKAVIPFTVFHERINRNPEFSDRLKAFVNDRFRALFDELPQHGE